MKPILECQGLTKKYNNFYALSNLNLTLDRGQIIGLLGPNGSGKTTLIKLINGLLTPTDGRVMINSLAPGAETKKLVSYLPERSYLNDHMRVEEILSISMIILIWNVPGRCCTIWRLIRTHGCAHFQKGQRKKYSLCWL